MRSTMTAALALLGLVSVVGTALAQGSTGAPAGTPAATAPGGTEGAAAIPNEREAIRSGDAIPAPPGVGVPVETPPRPGMEPPPPPPPPRP
ncbi:hypothetical protein [Methylorubrum suomiense]|uniref:Uncharacterized protein n=1 Tax=Methylorubrum suomiense TaxID=144191 RepID=A0ABQ4V093_9HYPH|nr:hypothetical protein [Methylorubrum suomiense]GJE77838.1 hypothetical protein BGCPKDLD_4445 [Methylorubrum suomiense]